MPIIPPMVLWRAILYYLYQYSRNYSRYCNGYSINYILQTQCSSFQYLLNSTQPYNAFDWVEYMNGENLDHFYI